MFYGIEEIYKKNPVGDHGHDSKGILQSILNSLEEGVLVINGEGGIIYYNQKFIEMLHIPEDLMLQKQTSEVRDWIRGRMDHSDDFFIELENKMLKEENFSLECRLKDGRYMKCFVNQLITGDLKGRVFCTRDVTPKKLFEKQLMESKRNYKQLLDQLPDALILEEDTRCIYANHSAARLFGFDLPMEMIGETLSTYLTEESRKIYHEHKNNWKREPMDNQTLELEIRGDQGSKWVTISTYLYTQRDQLRLTILKDITEEKLYRELREMLQKREEVFEKKRLQEQLTMEFYANLSHDLKTPINVISAVGQMIKTQAKNHDPKMEGYVNVLETNCKRLVKIVNESIDMDKLEKGYLKTSLQSCNIVNLLEDITQSILPYAEKKGIEVVFDTDLEDCEMETDSTFMERILLNLLSNAVKFTPPGGEIQVSLSVLENDIIIWVKDTGIGMDKEDLPLIFERYGKVRHTNENNFLGSGIGLYLVKKFVGLLGGRITAFSEKGKGSTFQVVLPRKEQGNLLTELNSRRGWKLNYHHIADIELSDL